MRKLILLLLPACLLLGCSDDDSPVDTTPPSSAVNDLPAEVTSTTFAVSWSGTDSGSGVKHYDVQSKDGDGSWADWLTATTLTTSDFTGVDGHTYYFRCRAQDNSGNLEAYPDVADAQTTVAIGPGAEWERTFGGSDRETGRWVEQTADGGYVIVGDTYSYGAGDRDVYVVKTSSTGELEWDETAGGTDMDTGTSIRRTTGGGYIIGGSTRSFGGGEQDIYIVKLNSGGGWEWDVVYGGPLSESVSCIIHTSDGGYLAAGSASTPDRGYDICVIKITSGGSVDWYETYGGTLNEFGRAVEEVSTGGYVITGGTHSIGAGGRDVYLLRVDESGDSLWDEAYGGAGEDYGLSVDETADGGSIIGGQTTSFGAGGVDGYLVKVTSGGVFEWDATCGGTEDDYGTAVRQAADGGYVLAGETYSLGFGETDAFLVKMDSGGNLEWSKIFGGTNWEGFNSLDLTTDGGYILVGTTTSFGDEDGDLYLVKIEPD